MDRPVVQLLLLLLALPAQYLITLWGSTSTDDTSIRIRKLIATLQEFSATWFDPKTWVVKLNNLFAYFTNNQGHCVAVEVMKYRSPVGHFGNSPEPRHDRPVKVKYKIGQVFLHKNLGYHGIIIGWDSHAKAPDNWLEASYGNEAMEKSLQPHYAVLPDQTEFDKSQTYISQDDIEIVSQRGIENDLVNDYFEVFDGTEYQPRSFMKGLYPKD